MKQYKFIKFFYFFIISTMLLSCASGRYSAYDPHKKLSVNELHQDYDLMQKILEDDHPSLYWYATKEQMDSIFDAGKSKIKDSMNEFAFRRIIASVVSAIKCGHTSVRASKGFDKWSPQANFSYFPFGARVYADTMVVAFNLFRKDTLLPRGTVLKSINGIETKDLLKDMYQYSSTDANANNFKNIRISNNFPFHYLLAKDSSRTYHIEYYDSLGNINNIKVGHYKLPPPDTTKKIVRKPVTARKLSRKERKEIKRNDIRRLLIDTLNSTATLRLTSFSGGRQKKFFKESFKTLGKLKIQHLVLDVRNNGGGLIGNSNALTRYIADKPFKIADTVFAKKRFSKYNKYIKFRFWYGVSMLSITTKKNDGNYYFKYLQNKTIKPKRQFHFTGNVYAITGGYSFSATTLFLNTIKGQHNVKLVGEETGGSSYGNSAVYIPDITLPHSKLRVRLPMFRLVMKKNTVNTMQGITPDYYVPPTPQSIKSGIDNKMEKVLELIQAARKK